MTLSNKIKRWWRSRGHGVHSPFAFRFITTVLRQPTPYYAYPEIDRLEGDPSWHRLLLRLVCEFEPTVIHSSHLSDVEHRVITLADSRARLTGHSPFPASFPPGVIEMLGKECRVIVIRDLSLSPHEWPRIKAALDYGMTFTNGKTGIVVLRPDLPREDFEINF